MRFVRAKIERPRDRNYLILYRVAHLSVPVDLASIDNDELIRSLRRRFVRRLDKGDKFSLFEEQRKIMEKVLV